MHRISRVQFCVAQVAFLLVCQRQSQLATSRKLHASADSKSEALYMLADTLLYVLLQRAHKTSSNSSRKGADKGFTPENYIAKR